MAVDTKTIYAAALAAIGLIAAAGPAVAQLTASAFTAYNPANAASISPGLYSLYSIPLDSLIPTQINIGSAETNAKAAGDNLLSSTAALNSYLLGEVEPVVIGPDGNLYQTDGHHTFVGLLDSKWGASNPNVYVDVIANYTGDTAAQFQAALAANAQLYPFANGVQQTVSASGSNLLSPLPSSLAGLTNDAYRGLEYSVLKNKASAGVGHDKTPGYGDFMWADLYRTAVTATGTGLATLTVNDANTAAAFSLNGNNTGTIPGYGTVKVNQMPGYILPSGGSITVTGTIGNATLANGALDGSNSGTVSASSASFNGLNGYSANGIVIQPHVSGFVMQLGGDAKSTVTLAGTNNTYTGGTTITAGTLIAAADGSLGAAPTGAGITAGNVSGSVLASNGIDFESLSEGAGTLRFGTTTGGAFNTARNIAIGEEVANFDMNGNTVTLTGNIATSNLNTSGAGPLIVNDNTGKGTLILAPASGGNPLFNGNVQISSGTLEVFSDAALGNASGPAYEIGQIQLDGGTLKAGAVLTSGRNVFLSGGSTIDTNGFASSFGALTDVQRTLTVANSGSAAGSATFGSLEVAATATIALNHGTSAGVAVTLTDGITRDANATLFLAPKSGSLGTTEQVFSSGASVALTHGIVAPWIVIDTGGSVASSPYSFATYGTTTGYGIATAANTGGASAVSGSTGSQLVVQAANATLANGGAAYALQMQSGTTLTVGSGKTLTIGDGTNPAGLIMNGIATISGGTLAFGGSEALIYAKGSTTNSNTINAVISGTGGITLSGSGNLNLGAVSTNTGAVTIDSGTLTLTTANAISAASGVNLLNVKSSPSNAVLALGASQTLQSLNSSGNNSSVTLASGTRLTIGDSHNDGSTYSGGFTEAGSAVSGAITIAGTGLVDLTGGGSKAINLVAASTVAVTGGQLRLNSNAFTNANAISLASGTELQVEQGGTGAFANNVTGSGVLHIETGAVQLTGTGNTYSGGTTMEVGTTLTATTSTLSSAANQTIANAGGTLVLDQTTTGSFTGVMSDGTPQGTATSQSGNFVKDDSTGANSGNVTLTKAQTYTGTTTVAAGTLTLGAANAVSTSSGVTLGRVGGGATATLALGAANTVQSLTSTANDTSNVQLNGQALTVSGNLNAAGTLNLTGGTVSVTGTVINNGTMSVNSVSAFYDGTFTNNGLLRSDPSTQTFSTLSVGQTGAIQASIGDLYKISGDFLNASTQSGTWNTLGADLEFTGGTSHALQLAGADEGDTAPVNRTAFAWAELTIDAGDSLTLSDGLTGGGAVAFYVDDIVGVLLAGNTVTNIDGDGLNIYYDPYDAVNGYLGGLTYDLTGGGQLIADVPEPASMAILLTGLAGGILARRRARQA